MGDAAQLDLVVVGDEQLAARRGDERPAEQPALVAAHRDVVQVRAVRAEPAGAGDGLVERGVDAPVGGDLGEQALAVRAAQLLDLAVLQQRADELGPLVAQLLQRRRVGRGAGLGLLDRRQPAPGRRRGVQDLAQLDRRVDVEVVAPDDLAQLGAEPLHLGGQALVELAEVGDVDGDAGVLHPGQHAHERVLDRRVQVGHALLGELRRDRLDEVVHGERLAAGDRRRVGVRAVEVELALGRRLVDRRGEAGVALDEVGQLVARLGRVEQVGGDRRVELEPAEVDAARRAAPRISALTSWPRTSRAVDSASATARSSRWSAGIHATRRAVGVGDDGQAAQRAAPRLALPRRGEVDGVERRRAAAPTRPATPSSTTSATSCSRSSSREHDRRRAERLGEALGERAELEEVEQPLDLVHVRLHHERLGQLDGRVAAQDHHLVVLADPLLVLGERRPQLRRLLVDVGEDAVEPAVRVDQLGRRLLPDAGHAGQVVARVAAQRGVLRVLRRRDAGALDDAGLVVERVVADAAPVVEHLDVGVLDELVGVAVAGDDDDVVAAADGLLGGRGDEVVGLPAGELARRHAERRQHLADEAHLLAQGVGRGVAVGLVRLVGLVAERRLGPVERDQHLVGALLLEHVDEHRREPEHGVGELPARRRHVLRAGRRRRGTSTSCRRPAAASSRSTPSECRAIRVSRARTPVVRHSDGLNTRMLMTGGAFPR